MLDRLFGRKPMQVEVQANVEWQIGYDERGGVWLGICTPLNLNAMGDTQEDLAAAIGETMHLLMLDLLKDGELEAFLREHGWRLNQALPPPSRKVQFHVPYRQINRNVRDLVAAH